MSTVLEPRHRLGYSFRDCKVVAAVMPARCATLFTEDLHHGKVIDGGPRIIDPMREPAGST